MFTPAPYSKDTQLYSSGFQNGFSAGFNQGFAKADQLQRMKQFDTREGFVDNNIGIDQLFKKYLPPNKTPIKWRSANVGGPFLDSCYGCQVPAYDGNPDVMNCQCPVKDDKTGFVTALNTNASIYLPWVQKEKLNKIQYDKKNGHIFA